ncbi:hypothetical protein J2Z17_001336 [Rhizobium halophytocola]|uniref:Uncharacterized protein n=1 Tax=Rhizobium halophytocola TaxID=735519 RepID=A0ABS4DW51_9HYPH|nr:hypothetical protein [Rhizobium halophytocola]
MSYEIRPGLGKKTVAKTWRKGADAKLQGRDGVRAVFVRLRRRGFSLGTGAARET